MRVLPVRLRNREEWDLGAAEGGHAPPVIPLPATPDLKSWSGTIVVIPWFPDPEWMTTGRGEPAMCALEVAAALAVAR